MGRSCSSLWIQFSFRRRKRLGVRFRASCAGESEPFTAEAAGRIAAGGEGSAITAQKPARSAYLTAGPNPIELGTSRFVCSLF